MPALDGRTKLVVRHLPPNLPEDVFWRSVAPWVPDEANSGVQYRAFVPGKVRKTRDKANLFSRAYIQFATFTQVVAFHKAFDEHAFRDSRGRIYLAKVEFAPYQKAVVAPSKPDQRQGTIEDDHDYLRFIEQLDSPVEGASADASPAAEPPTTTPLIEHLRAQRKSATAISTVKKRQPAKSATRAQVAAHPLPSTSQSQSQKSGSGKSAAKPMSKESALALPADKASQPRRTKANRTAQAQPSQTPADPAPGAVPRDSGPPAPASASAKQPVATGRERKKGPHRRDPAAQNLTQTQNSAATQAPPPPGDTVKAGPSGQPVSRPGGPAPTRKAQRRHRGPPVPTDSDHVPAASTSAANSPATAPAASARPRRVDAEDSAGARRRLGNALAGIGGGGQRRRKGQGQGAAVAKEPGSPDQA